MSSRIAFVFIQKPGFDGIKVGQGHDKRLALQFSKDLFGNKFEYVYESDQDNYDRYNPKTQIGVFEGGYIIEDYDFAIDCLSGGTIIQRLTNQFDAIKILVEIDYYILQADAYYHNGALIRKLENDQDEFQSVCEGMFSDEEKQWLEKNHTSINLDVTSNNDGPYSDEHVKVLVQDHEYYIHEEQMDTFNKLFGHDISFPKSVDDYDHLDFGIMSCFQKRPWYRRLFGI